MKLEFEGDFYEDKGNFQAIILSHKMASAIYDARNVIRHKIKYSEDLSDEEMLTLDRIDEALCVEGLDV